MHTDFYLNQFIFDRPRAKDKLAHFSETRCIMQDTIEKFLDKTGDMTLYGTDPYPGLINTQTQNWEADKWQHNIGVEVREKIRIARNT